jgi:PAS domain S-box-containing protein
MRKRYHRKFDDRWLSLLLIVTYAIFAGCSYPFVHEIVLEMFPPASGAVYLVFLADTVYASLSVLLIAMLVYRLVMLVRTFEREIQRSEAQFRALVESTRDWVWEVDHDMCYTFASTRVEGLLGYLPAEMIGRTPYEFMPTEEARRVAELLSRVAAKHEAFFLAEMTFRHKAGHLVIVETSCTPYVDARGVFQGYRGIDRDITERRAAERALRVSEERYRSLFQHMAEGLAVFEEVRNSQGMPVDYLVAAVNPAFEAMLGVGREDLIGRSAANVLHAFDEDTYVQLFSHDFHDGTPSRHEIYLPVAQKHFHAAMCRFHDSEYALFITDVTDRRNAEDALARSADFYRTLFDTIPLPVWRTNTAGRMVYCNAAWRASMGPKAPVIEDADWWLAAVHPDDADAFADTFAEAQRRQAPFTAPCRVRHPDGPYLRVQHLGRPLYDADGVFVGYIGFFHEVSSDTPQLAP